MDEKGTQDREKKKGVRRRKRALRAARAVQVLPAAVTLCNLLCGFAAIHFAVISKEIVWEKIQLSNFALSAYCIFLAMLADALDGRIARRYNITTDFGAQLDSLADVVSFGVAPGFLMLHLLIKTLGAEVTGGTLAASPWAATVIGRIIWLIAAIYVGATAMRLARFTVETQPEEEFHLYFTGLPSPAAAGTVASLIILHQALQYHRLIFETALKGGAWLIIVILPVITLASAWLMVSRIRYSHLMNQFLRKRGRFIHVVWILVVGGSMLICLQVALAVCCLAYTLSGPIQSIILARKSKRQKSS